MLEILVESQETFDEETNTFDYPKPTIIRMEHSLISISKWEAIWETPFLPTPGIEDGMTGRIHELSYIQCMIIGKFSSYIPEILLDQYSDTIREYIEKKSTATVMYRGAVSQPSRQVITNELIYYWMIRFNIPFECQRWHLNRLLTLIDVCSVKESGGSKDGKMSPAEAAKYMHQLNKARRSA